MVASVGARPGPLAQTNTTTQEETVMDRTVLVSLCVLGLAAAQPAPGQGQDEASLEERSSLEERLSRVEAALEETDGEGDDDEWDFRWSNGFKLTSPDGALDFEFGGRLQNDWAFYEADDALEATVGPFEEGTEFRRARLFFQGELYDRVEFKAQYDFAGGDAEIKDAYLGLIHLPVVGGLRVGHFNEPFSLEEQTSSKYITFMERALPVEAFSPARNTGFMLHRGEERYTWAVGAFRDADGFGDAVDRDGVNLTGRVTALPWYADGGRRLLHLGVSVSEREPTEDAVRFRSRPESHLAPRVVDTGAFGADGLTLVDLEGALVHGPFSAQAEYVQAAVDTLPGAGSDPDFDSFYVYGSWFPTGEHRPYKTSAGAFDRLKPRRPWGDGGAGAWEVAVRYSSLDLADAGLAGGQVDDVTLGLNWYPYANVRWMLNYVLTDRDGVGEADAVQMRLQVDF